ncbi:ABC transporter permease [Diplocloster agilis]|uniref:ABC transporter permease n=1 Tax=Diplocloster agilis TaxID=2850323 RepID=A0A949JWU3_9FIRM|nr:MULTISPECIES: ABC transporter permease [Lachnospiraceae]MBU9735192.1 ABC transporter permease [Diplocloster agilis]MBU9743590.1 ABC transporter permease [Diplocloster agilis]MCU6733842.1 ABC transporter permease [Suonthocola fibrivorans]SCJ10839.1 Putative aliphatic sulfonates transport permease protein ssuC [uncultured Clostridium sp.]
MNDLSISQAKYLAEHIRHKRIVTIARIMVFVIFMLLWEVTTRLQIIDSFIFSSPSRIATTFISMTKDGSIFTHIGITLAETLVSFMLVNVIGVAVAVLLWLSKKTSEIMEPYLVVLNSLPKSALAPLLIVWLGANTKTIIVAGISVAIFGTIISMYAGFVEVNPEKIKLIYTLGGRKRHALFKVVLPSNIPNLISNMKVNIGLSLVGVIIGEFLAARRGLGYLIIYGSQVFKLDWVMMSIVILCIIAMVLYKLINLLEKCYLKRI